MGSPSLGNAVYMSNRVNMSAHQMSAQPISERKRSFQVHLISAGKRAEHGAGQRLRGSIGSEGKTVPPLNTEAGSINRNRLPLKRFFPCKMRSDAQPELPARRGNRCYRSTPLN